MNPGLWGVGDKLTSAQENALDANTTYALDKRAGETDTLESVVQCSGAGRIIPTVYVGPDANATIDMATGIQIVRAPALTAARTYTLGTATAIDGDTITIFAQSGMYNLTVKTGSTTLRVLGGSAGNEGLIGTFMYNSGTTAWERTDSRGSTIAVEEFTSNGTWTSPAWVTAGLAIGYGGGGGGGGGATAGTTIVEHFVGGGGGGSAMQSCVPFSCAASTAYAVTIGVGGAGGSVIASNGGNTTLGSLATFLGAGKGVGSSAGKSTSLTKVMYAHGGKCTAGQTSRNLSITGTGFSYFDASTPPTGITYLEINQQLCEGGAGTTNNLTFAETGAPCNAGGYAGGAAGTVGTNSSDYKGGGAGGGGAAGPGGAGAAGGNGGNANNGGTGANGTAGANAPANSGAGGGGGGAGGAGSSAGGAGGNGGNGGSGRLYVIYTVRGA